MAEYNHINITKHTSEEREAAIGKRAIVRLTGQIVAARDSGSGGYVVFRVDERWGLGPFSLAMDLECFDIEENE
jgi:hypothetical protein